MPPDWHALDDGDFPTPPELLPTDEARIEVGLFLAMCWLRTPVSREQRASVIEQVIAAMTAETYKTDPTLAQRAFADTDMSPDEIDAFRVKFVQDLENGDLFVEYPKNNLIKHFLEGSLTASALLYMFDWTLIRTSADAPEFIIADTPFTVYDADPPFPGAGVGLMSSISTECFFADRTAPRGHAHANTHGLGLAART